MIPLLKRDINIFQPVNENVIFEYKRRRLCIKVAVQVWQTEAAMISNRNIYYWVLSCRKFDSIRNKNLRRESRHRVWWSGFNPLQVIWMFRLTSIFKMFVKLLTFLFSPDCNWSFQISISDCTMVEVINRNRPAHAVSTRKKLLLKIVWWRPEFKLISYFLSIGLRRRVAL
jgi:hypothetical protein